jgi:glutamyl/glutaminyl-tRNA synthetase
VIPTGDAATAAACAWPPTARTTGRLAPTPSGRLHLGNVVAFGAAWLSAKQAQGRVLLRVEDVDSERAREDLANGLRNDLRWLGLTWDAETTPQHARSYEAALTALTPHRYACRCTRRDWTGAYPGTCRSAQHSDGASRFRLPEGVVAFEDRALGRQVVDPTVLGDPVLQRRDGMCTYALAVVVDDIRDGVTEVVRGSDLREATGVQLRLYEALNAPPPTWMHTPMLVDANGRKLGKSHGSRSIEALRRGGASPQDVWRRVLPWLGVVGATHVHDAVASFRPTGMVPGPIAVADDPEEA